LEIGQVAALFDEILPAGKIVENVMNEFRQSVETCCSGGFDFI